MASGRGRLAYWTNGFTGYRAYSKGAHAPQISEHAQRIYWYWKWPIRATGAGSWPGRPVAGEMVEMRNGPSRYGARF